MSGKQLPFEMEKISLAECKKILNTDGLFYSDEEIIEIRDFLYQLADIAMDDLEKDRIKKEKKSYS